MVVIMKEQGFDPETITGQHEDLLPGIPQREREHPPQPRDAGPSMLLVQMHDHFGIGLGPEAMPFRGEFLPQLAVVVDLAVADHDDRPVLIRHRLAAARHVDNAETAHPDPHSGSGTPKHARPVVIRATVLQRPPHRSQQRRQTAFATPRAGVVTELGDAENAAHAYVSAISLTEYTKSASTACCRRRSHA